MNPTIEISDIISLLPFLLILFALLSTLLFKSFELKQGSYFSGWISILAISISLIAILLNHQATNPLLTRWLRFDELSRVLNIYLLCIGLATTLLTFSFAEKFKQDVCEYFFLLLSSLFGLLLINSSADFLTLFLGLETLSIALYVWTGYMKSWARSKEAAIKYFLLGALSTAFLVYGIALIYGVIGNTRLEGLQESYQGLKEPTEHLLFLCGAAFVTVGLAFKAAIFPFHSWAPDVYDGAPTPVVAFMATGTKLGAFSAFATIFLNQLHPFLEIWHQGISLLACATLIYANFVALQQQQLRRFFAYSGISHAGYALIPIATGSPDALSALLFYLAVYILSTLGAFAIVSFIDSEEQGVTIEDLKGLFYRSPYLASLLTIFLLTLGGIPPTVGFFAKFFIFKTAFESQNYLLAFIGIAVSILSAYYYSRIALMTFQKPEKEMEEIETWKFSFASSVVAISAVGMIVFISIFPASLLEWLSSMNR